jgi:hypothetical protein
MSCKKKIPHPLKAMRNEVPHTGKRGTKRSIYGACDAVCSYLR